MWWDGIKVRNSGKTTEMKDINEKKIIKTKNYK